MLNSVYFLFVNCIADGKMVVQHPVVSPVKRMSAADSKSGYDSVTSTPTTAAGHGGGGGGIRSANASPMHARLMEVMSQVEIANESVQKAVAAAASGAGGEDSNGGRLRSRSVAELKADSQTSTPSRRSNSGISSSSSQQQLMQQQRVADVKDVQRLDEHRVPLLEQEDEDDLEYTLDNWLTQQKRGVTQRRKHHEQNGNPDVDAEEQDLLVSGDSPPPAEEEGLEGYLTVKNYHHDRMSRGVAGDHRGQQAKHDGGGGAGGSGADEEVQDDGFDFYTSGAYEAASKETDGNDSDRSNDRRSGAARIGGAGAGAGGGANGVVRGKYMGNDVEVVGLQCMLAQALMGDGEEGEDD